MAVLLHVATDLEPKWIRLNWRCERCRILTKTHNAVYRIKQFTANHLSNTHLSSTLHLGGLRLNPLHLKELRRLVRSLHQLDGTSRLEAACTGRAGELEM